jgi:hypothetical protein
MELIADSGTWRLRRFFRMISTQLPLLPGDQGKLNRPRVFWDREVNLRILIVHEFEGGDIIAANARPTATRLLSS